MSPGRAVAHLEIDKLVAAGDREGLEKARSALVQRLHDRSDDLEATAGLSRVNQALAEVGWRFAYDWKHRRKP